MMDCFGLCLKLWLMTGLLVNLVMMSAVTISLRPLELDYERETDTQERESEVRGESQASNNGHCQSILLNLK